MAQALIWSEEALDDVDRIAEYIGRDSPCLATQPGVTQMITEEQYSQYIRDFNDSCAGNGMGFAAFFDKWYEPDATFEYLPKAAKNSGKEKAVAFWTGVSEIMQETIRPHSHFVASPTTVASEAPIDFLCKKDLDWVGVEHKAGTSFRLMMAAFYEVSQNDKFKYVRVYSIYHPAYQVDRS